jgi:hypothetical protein
MARVSRPYAATLHRADHRVPWTAGPSVIASAMPAEGGAGGSLVIAGEEWRGLAAGSRGGRWLVEGRAGRLGRWREAAGSVAGGRVVEPCRELGRLDQGPGGLALGGHSHDVPGEACALEQPDEQCGGVELEAMQSVERRGRERVVVVVPGFAERRE